ncbi:MAG: HEPN domain-containing protein [Rhodocyclaceae bacterium]|nr:HEPN domain-containing protein [Rhodocyclaceae bacterium]
MSRHDEQAATLIAAAERDHQTFQILSRDPSSPNETMLFHAQQALEKALKAVLVAKGVIFPRTHDLLALSDLAAGNDIEVPIARDLLTRLVPYAVEFRYLGVMAPEVSREEAAGAVTACLAWAKELLS